MTRIIGGTAGGRRLKTPTGEATRPTSDRVREALFSALESELGSLTGLRFLDLYAGSGAVGLEAMSRGAGVVTVGRVGPAYRQAGAGQRRHPRLPQGRGARPAGRARAGQHPAGAVRRGVRRPAVPHGQRGGRARRSPCSSTTTGWPRARCSSWSARRVAWNPPGRRGWCASARRSTARPCSGTFAPIPQTRRRQGDPR